MNYIFVFFLLFFLDIAWSFYINKVKDGSALQAASCAAGLFGLGAISTISYVQNPYLLIPAVMGAFCGTYVGVLLNKK